MSVTIDPDLENRIRERMAAGNYGSPEEVLQEALRVLGERDSWREEVRQAIAEGQKSLDRGDHIDGERFFEELAEKSKRRRQQG